jgi:hypothetical protein
MFNGVSVELNSIDFLITLHAKPHTHEKQQQQRHIARLMEKKARQKTKASERKETFKVTYNVSNGSRLLTSFCASVLIAIILLFWLKTFCDFAVVQSMAEHKKRLMFVD